MQQANRKHTVGSVFVEQQIIAKWLNDPFANLRRMAESRFRSELRVSRQKFQVSFDGLAKVLRRIRIGFTQRLNDLRVVREKERTFMKISRHALL